MPALTTDGLDPPKSAATDEYQDAAANGIPARIEQPAMTAAHTALLVQLLTVLECVPNLALCRGETPADEMGNLDFGRRLITIARDLPFAESVSTLAHELVHLGRGPCYIDEEEHEEVRVIDETARLLVPASYLPAILDRTTPRRIAAELGIDVDTAAPAVKLAIRDRQRRTVEVA